MHTHSAARTTDFDLEKRLNDAVMSNRLVWQIWQVSVRDTHRNGERQSGPYELTNLLAAVEVTSAGKALYDFQTKRSFYLREGGGTTSFYRTT